MSYLKRKLSLPLVEYSLFGIASGLWVFLMGLRPGRSALIGIARRNLALLLELGLRQCTTRGRCPE